MSEMKNLGDYRDLCAVLAGEGSAAVKFFDDKIAKSKTGRAEKVIAAESQMMFLIGSLLDTK